MTTRRDQHSASAPSVASLAQAAGWAVVRDLERWLKSERNAATRRSKNNPWHAGFRGQRIAFHQVIVELRRLRMTHIKPNIDYATCGSHIESQKA